MKLTHLALVLTLGLLSITGWIAWSEHSDAKSSRNQLELYQRHGPASASELQSQEDQLLLEQIRKNARAAPSAAPAPMPSALPPIAPAPVMPGPAVSAPVRSGPAAALSASPHISQSSIDAVPPPLTPQQRKVRDAPAIAKVSEFQQQYGFVVVTAGANRKLEKGMSFALRHDGFVVGRIKISEVDDNSAVGDVDSKSVPAGVTIEAGDDVIQDVPPGQ